MSHTNENSLQNAEEAAGTLYLFPEFNSFSRSTTFSTVLEEKWIDNRWMNDTTNAQRTMEEGPIANERSLQS